MNKHNEKMANEGSGDTRVIIIPSRKTVEVSYPRVGTDSESYGQSLAVMNSLVHPDICEKFTQVESKINSIISKI